MADFTLTASPTFPAGTTVNAYPLFAAVRDGEPIGPVVASAVVQSSGTATFNGLAFDTRYVAAAQVSGAWRAVSFTTSSDPTGEPATKGYVDSVASSGAADASTTVKGLSRLSAAPAVASDPIAVSDNDPRNTNARAPTAHTHPQSEVTNLATDLAAKAPLASPALTGTPTAPTAVAGTNTTQLATTAFVLANGGSIAPGSLAPHDVALGTLTANATVDFTSNKYDVVIRLTLGASIILNLANVPPLARVSIRVVQGASNYALTIHLNAAATDVWWDGGTEHVMSSAAGAVDRIAGEMAATTLELGTVGKAYAV